MNGKWKCPEEDKWKGHSSFCIIKEESFAKSRHLKGMVGRHEAESYLSGVRLVNLAISVQLSGKNC